MAYEIDIDLCYHNDFVGKEITLETQQKTPKIQRSNLFVEKVVLTKTNSCQIWGVKYLTLGKKIKVFANMRSQLKKFLFVKLWQTCCKKSILS